MTNKKVKRLPTSGSEALFVYDDWITNKGVNNCYAYAVNDLRTYRARKSVPGNRSGLSNKHHTYTHCKGLTKRVISDNPKNVYKTKASKPCKSGFYKIMMFTAKKPKNSLLSDPYGDFHFFKQHNEIRYKVKDGDTAYSISKFFNVPISRIKKHAPFIAGKKIQFKVNTWSHKMGWATGPLLTDSCGKTIKDPRKACKNYSFNYKNYCSSMCVRKNAVKAGKNSKITHQRF